MDSNFSRIENLHKEIKHYDTETMYMIKADQSACFYELFVNDFLVFRHFEQTSLLGHAVSINDAILKSGLQEVTVKLYPIGEYKGKNYNTFSKNAEIEILIEKYDNANEDSDDEEVLKIKIPQIENKDNLIRIKGLPYYEHTFTFNAEVPYTLKGWSESQDLTKMDKDELEKEVVTFYKSFRNLIKLKQSKEIEDQIYSREKEIAQSNFYSKEKLKKLTTELKSNLITPIDIPPLEKDYKLVFYGNGNVVKLESKKYKSINNNSALSVIDELNYIGKLRKAKVFLSLALHKPKGSNKLEIIR